MNNKFFCFFRKTAIVILISALWLICCIPVITVGASCAAMYCAIFDLREDKPGCVKNFFRGFRKCFALGTKVWLTLVAVAGAVFVVSRFVGVLQIQLLSTVTVAAACAVLLICWVLLVSVFPLTAYFDTTLKKTWRNAAFVAVKHRKQTVRGAILAAIPVVLLMILPEVFFWTSGIWALLFPGAMAYYIASRLTPILQSYGEKRKEKLKQENEVQS